jgi:cytochrome P450
MTEKKQLAWDPLDKSVLTDQIAAYDRMRKQCPVAHSDYLHWSLFKHAEIMRVLTDTRTFSNAVSHRHVAIPNGMDPPKHTEYRRIIDRYFIAERMKEFEPTCRTIVERLIRLLVNQQEVDWVTDFADIFAVQVQCAFLDWPASLHEPLLAWTRKNQAATLSGNVAAMDAVAVEFDGYIRERLNESRNLTGTRDDPVARLLQERVFDRQLTDEEIVSILRNWTVGELSTISACISILMHYLALHPFLQEQLRNKAELLPAAIEEILRIHPPLIASRRITTSAVNLGGCAISQSERITVMWASANRDDAVFGDPDEFRLDRDTSQNLLYGAGIHYCPGAPLARLELRIAIEELLRRTGSLKLSARGNPVRATYPASGFSSLQLSIDWNARPKYPRAE